ncbi:hypothetical protein BDQ94DRAFT_147771 [Aspergillus welwitschiae]|uniref:Uncharacterized protein n=1 Tax=Aspergillus welwitschiae TaxID=1341132 RepID=A0A3F3PXA5_9EURO|nr:hypothetical protein BDQ94DRAFT_147771 [Aspergillus welwitschiae]RDH30946.1 hypothetical protein BDQ94DRAFT_147771 [Aspergillus welwitschiae]
MQTNYLLNTFSDSLFPESSPICTLVLPTNLPHISVFVHHILLFHRWILSFLTTPSSLSLVIHHSTLCRFLHSINDPSTASGTCSLIPCRRKEPFHAADLLLVWTSYSCWDLL